jgi:hypothetical protein
MLHPLIVIVHKHSNRKDNHFRQIVWKGALQMPVNSRNESRAAG